MEKLQILSKCKLYQGFIIPQGRLKYNFQAILQIPEGAVFKHVDGNKSKNGKLTKGC